MSAGPQAPCSPALPCLPAGSWDGGPSTQTPKWWLREKAGKVKVHPHPGRWAWKGPGGPPGVRWWRRAQLRRGCAHRPVPRAALLPGEECGLGSVDPTFQEGTLRLPIPKVQPGSVSDPAWPTLNLLSPVTQRSVPRVSPLSSSTR